MGVSSFFVTSCEWAVQDNGWRRHLRAPMSPTYIYVQGAEVFVPMYHRVSRVLCQGKLDRAGGGKSHGGGQNMPDAQCTVLFRWSVGSCIIPPDDSGPVTSETTAVADAAEMVGCQPAESTRPPLRQPLLGAMGDCIVPV